MIRVDALQALLRKLGEPPSQVVLSVQEFRAASPLMSCVALSCYCSLDDGQHAGLAAWAHVENNPVFFVAWEWCEIHANAVGMRDPTDVSTNVQLVDHHGRKIDRVRGQIELASAIHGWEWWNRVDPARLCLGSSDPSPR